MQLLVFLLVIVGEQALAQRLVQPFILEGAHFLADLGKLLQRFQYLRLQRILHGQQGDGGIIVIIIFRRAILGGLLAFFLLAFLLVFLLILIFVFFVVVFIGFLGAGKRIVRRKTVFLAGTG